MIETSTRFSLRRGESKRDVDIPRTHRLFNPGTCKVWLIGLMHIGEIDGLVIAWREVNVAQHLVAVGAFAFEVYREAGTLPFPTQDSGETKHRVDVVSGYHHP
jgi:hypothetical protein